MKKMILLAASFLMLNGLVQSQSKYEAAMQKNIAALDSAYSPQEMTELANAFQRIAEAEKNQWLPYYYAAFCRLYNGMLQAQSNASQADELADQGEALLDKAAALTEDNSELQCLRKTVATLRMLADPMTRFQQYSAIGAMHLAKARKMDPSNPRPDLMEAQDLYYTPEQFGGDRQKAVEMLGVALVKYDAFQPASSLHPVWGRNQVERLLKEAKAAGN